MGTTPLKDGRTEISFYGERWRRKYNAATAGVILGLWWKRTSGVEKFASEQQISCEICLYNTDIIITKHLKPLDGREKYIA